MLTEGVERWRTVFISFQGMLSPWRDRDDFDDNHDEVLHLVKGRDHNHESNVILGTENRK